MEREVYYVKDVAEMFAVTRQAVNYWCKNGTLKYSELPTGRRFFTREQIEDFKNGKTK